ncbi:MAG TPA: G8 domain-containing protein [Pirellulales bacterium]|jgi:guanyl-specific ribonuclease Sa|nr:G8 domain-containing protein [Pirellulales bacterium]
MRAIRPVLRSRIQRVDLTTFWGAGCGFAVGVLLLTFALWAPQATAHEHEGHAASAAAAVKSADSTLAVVKSAASGLWSSPQTWQGGKIPAAGDRVLILSSHAVVYDVASDAVIRGISIAGKLAFARDKDTRLNVGLLKMEPIDRYSEEGFDCDALMDSPQPQAPATLEVGTARAPIPAGHTALIRLHYVEGLDKQSCPAIVCCGGRMDFHGAPLSQSWLKLGETAKKGDRVVTLAEPVQGWRPGDKLILTATSSDMATSGTRRPGQRTEKVQTEERILKSIAGATLTLDQPLEFAHEVNGDFRGEVADLSRNVIVESADPSGVRGHTMYHRDSAGSISYAEFRHLGKEGVLGRYAIHFHLVGNTMRGSSVVGASIWDSQNRWITIHGTNYLLIRDNVGYQSVGHGFFLEDGTEQFNVLDHNLAVQAYHFHSLPKQALPFDSNEGAGFWWANSLNTFTRNVSCENDRYGYRFEATQSSSFDIGSPYCQAADGSLKKTDIRTLPFVRFEDNEAHCDGEYGINLGEGVQRIGPDTRHPFVMRNTKIWQVHYAFRPMAPSLLVENMHIQDCEYGVYHPNYDNHVYRNLKIYRTDTEPFNRGHDDDSIQYGPLTVDGLEFLSKRSESGMPFIQISDDNPTGLAVSHFRNVTVITPNSKHRTALVNLGGGPRPTPTTESGVAYYMHDWYGPGRDAKVVSVKAKDLLADGNVYHADAPLTGDESVVAEVKGVEFPTLLNPAHDLAPTTAILAIEPAGQGKLLVRGYVADEGSVKRVLVNGQVAGLDAKSGDWKIEIPKPAGRTAKIEAHAEDAAGNVEKLGHSIVWTEGN